jgi:hypothetical protein
MFDHHSAEEAESMERETIMGVFLLAAIGVTIIAFVIYVVAAIRLERSAQKK